MITMDINHLQTGMILQVVVKPTSSFKTLSLLWQVLLLARLLCSAQMIHDGNRGTEKYQLKGAMVLKATSHTIHGTR